MVIIMMMKIQKRSRLFSPDGRKAIHTRDNEVVLTERERSGSEEQAPGHVFPH